MDNTSSQLAFKMVCIFCGDQREHWAPLMQCEYYTVRSLACIEAAFRLTATIMGIFSTAICIDCDLETAWGGERLFVCIRTILNRIVQLANTVTGGKITAGSGGYIRQT